MRLLIVDDNAAVRTTLKMVLGREYEVAAIGDPTLIPALLKSSAEAFSGTGTAAGTSRKEGEGGLRKERDSSVQRGGGFDAVLLDMNFDNAKLDCSDGFFWLERIKEGENAPAVVVITAFGDVDVAVRAMKAGAEDFVTKPWDNSVLSEKLRNAIATNRRRRSDEAAARRTREMEQALHERDNLTLDEVKVRHIRSVIERCGGNLSAAAEQLGVNRQTLYNILKKLP